MEYNDLYSRRRRRLEYFTLSFVRLDRWMDGWIYSALPSARPQKFQGAVSSMRLDLENTD